MHTTSIRSRSSRASIASLVLAASAYAAPTSRFDVQYALTPGADPAHQQLDIYGDTAWTARPVVIYAHGGCWQNGDKSAVAIKDDAFRDAGYVFVSINYRLAPTGAYPLNARDVAAAVAWVHRNAATFGANPFRIVLMGHSAGAHVVSLVATDPRYLADEGVPREALEAVIALDTGAHDLTLFAGTDGVLGGCHGETFGQDPAVWAEASPITYAPVPGPTPPFALPYSRGINPKGFDQHRVIQNQNMAVALQAAGVRADLIDGTYTTHSGINQNFGAPGDPVTEACFTFLASLAPTCAADTDSSGTVGFSDITTVLSNLGALGSTPLTGDADSDADVDFSDITTVLATFGSACR